MKFGVGATTHHFSTFSSRANLPETELKTDFQLNEYFVYLQDKINISSSLSADVGIRYESYHINQKKYNKIQPRISLQYQLPKNNALFVSFSQTQQYIHLLQNNGFGIPNDIWVPTIDKVPPQTAYQFTLGGNYHFSNNINLVAEVYYKKTSNVIEYKPGLDENIYNQIGDWEKLVESGGEGESYGAELLLQKDYGKDWY